MIEDYTIDSTCCDKRLKEAAMSLCDKRGVNPNGMVEIGGEGGCAVSRRVPRWTLEAKEILSFIDLKREVEILDERGYRWWMKRL